MCVASYDVVCVCVCTRVSSSHSGSRSSSHTPTPSPLLVVPATIPSSRYPCPDLSSLPSFISFHSLLSLFYFIFYFFCWCSFSNHHPSAILDPDMDDEDEYTRPVAVSDPSVCAQELHAGWLLKKKTNRKKWIKRYFKLYRGELAYYRKVKVRLAFGIHYFKYVFSYLCLSPHSTLDPCVSCHCLASWPNHSVVQSSNLMPFDSSIERKLRGFSFYYGQPPLRSETVGSPCLTGTVEFRQLFAENAFVWSFGFRIFCSSLCAGLLPGAYTSSLARQTLDPVFHSPASDSDNDSAVDDSEVIDMKKARRASLHHSNAHAHAHAADDRLPCQRSASVFRSPRKSNTKRLKTPLTFLRMNDDLNIVNAINECARSNDPPKSSRLNFLHLRFGDKK
jgi:hypothetical protein